LPFEQSGQNPDGDLPFEREKSFEESMQTNYAKCWIIVVTREHEIAPSVFANSPNVARAEQGHFQDAESVMQEIHAVPDDAALQETTSQLKHQ
jgi:hypothetical protein